MAQPTSFKLNDRKIDFNLNDDLTDFKLNDGVVTFNLEGVTGGGSITSEPMLDFSIDTNSQYIPLF